MARLVKTYTFLSDINFEASEVNRNFDDLFDKVNGGLDSENFSAGFTPDASQVTFADAEDLFSATTVEEALQEPSRLQRGIHTIFVYPNGSNAVVFYPGVVEIGGKIANISTPLSASGLTFVDSGANNVGLYVVCQQPAAGEEITASDLGLIDATSITITATDTSLLGGYYYYDKYRLIGACWNAGTGCQSLLNYYNPDPPQGSFVKSDDGGVSGLELIFGITMAVGWTNSNMFINGMTTFYDHAAGAYGARFGIHINSATDVAEQRIVANLPGNPMYYNWHHELCSNATVNSSTAEQYLFGTWFPIFTSAADGGTDMYMDILMRPVAMYVDNR